MPTMIISHLRAAWLLIGLLLLWGCRSPELGLSPRAAPLPAVADSPFWQALSALDWKTLDALTVTPEQSALGKAVRLITEGKNETAERVLRWIIIQDKDQALTDQAYFFLFNLLFLQGRWSELTALGWGGDVDDVNGTFIVAFDNMAPEQINIPAQSVVLPYRMRFGSPVVDVQVNGQSEKFLLDTGSTFSAIASDVADKCGVKKLESRHSRVRTATSKKVYFQSGVITDLRLGAIQFVNHPVMIVPKKDMRIKRSLIRLQRVEEISGTIGWHALQHLRITVDSRTGTLTFRRGREPDPEASPDSRNFFWLGYPIVRTRTAQGVSLHFGVDTGAERTSLTESALKKIPAAGIRLIRRTVMSVGGSERRRYPVVLSLALLLGEKEWQIRDATVFPPFRTSAMIPLDGRIGCDLFKNGTVTIDFKAGLLAFRPFTADAASTNGLPHESGDGHE